MPRGSADGTVRVWGGVATRLLHVDGHPILVRAWQTAAERVVVRAEAVDPRRVEYRLGAEADRPHRIQYKRLVRS